MNLLKTFEHFRGLLGGRGEGEVDLCDLASRPPTDVLDLEAYLMTRAVDGVHLRDGESGRVMA